MEKYHPLDTYTSLISTTGEACCSASRVFWLKHGVNVHLSDTWMFLSLLSLSVAVISWKRLLYFRGKCGQSLHSFTDRWWMLQCQSWLTCLFLYAGIWRSIWALGLGKPLRKRSTSSSSCWLPQCSLLAPSWKFRPWFNKYSGWCIDLCMFWMNSCPGELRQLTSLTKVPPEQNWKGTKPWLWSGHWKMLTGNIPARKVVFSESFVF